MDKFKGGLKNAFTAVPKNAAAAKDLHVQFQGHLEKYPSLEKLEKATGRDRDQIIGAVLGFLFVLLMLGVFYKPLGIFMTRLFGFSYPAYQSFKAIESTGKDDDTQWLTYWMIFASFCLAEETILEPMEEYAPFFFVWKIVFLLWCYLPQTKGADLLYAEAVGPAARKVDEYVKSNFVHKKHA